MNKEGPHSFGMLAFETSSGQAHHFILDLMQLKHDHTGEALHQCLEQPLSMEDT